MGHGRTGSSSSPSWVFAGVDVGKVNLQLAIGLPDGKFLEQPFANTLQGRAIWWPCAKSIRCVQVVMEATGGLELDIAVDLAGTRDLRLISALAQRQAPLPSAINQLAKKSRCHRRCLQALFGQKLEKMLKPRPGVPYASNAKQRKVDWQFLAGDARRKTEIRLRPKIIV